MLSTACARATIALSATRERERERERETISLTPAHELFRRPPFSPRAAIVVRVFNSPYFQVLQAPIQLLRSSMPVPPRLFLSPPPSPRNLPLPSRHQYHHQRPLIHPHAHPPTHPPTHLARTSVAPPPFATRRHRAPTATPRVACGLARQALELAQRLYSWSGLNWRPSACEADAIATRPQLR